MFFEMDRKVPGSVEYRLPEQRCKEEFERGDTYGILTFGVDLCII